MTPESARAFYDRQYRSHMEGSILCPNSVHDLAKAERRVKGVLRSLITSAYLPKAEILDVGCGLGYYTKALSSSGASVTGIDVSDMGIRAAQAAFPECQFRCAAWPQDVPNELQFDLIWAVGLSLINTFDVQAINAQFIVKAMEHLKPNGFLVVGWHTDFSGRTVGGWSNWSFKTLTQMREICGLSSPRVPEAGSTWLSWIIIRLGHVLKRSVPVFMSRQKLA
jgi:SAM-dependent methyltransferase